MAVCVLDKNRRPLMPCTEKRARLLLERGRARVHRVRPFVIRLVDRTVDESEVRPLTVKIDPGSKTTGIALVRIDEAGATKVVNLVEVNHRGAQIRDALSARRAHRRHHRGSLRFRAKRFDNRHRPEGWLAPSLRHRVDTTMGEVARLRRWAPVGALAMELVRFDMQAVEDPGISGAGYQQGTLAGYEIREYVLEKWGRCCAYCDATGVPLEVDHIEPRSRGGSDRPSNLTLACVPCNRDKGARDVRDFVTDPRKLADILGHAKAPLRDAAAVNSTRWALFGALRATGLPVAVGTGGRTKWNRHRLGVPKTHALDAACVGVVEAIVGWNRPTLLVDAMGRGSYCRTRVDRHGFPRGYLTRSKDVRGFRTGDLVVALVPNGKKAGTWAGRVAVRATGSFNVQTGDVTVQGISHRHCRRVQRADGRRYATRPPAPRVGRATTFLPALKGKVSSGVCR